MNGVLEILSVGEGDTKLTFDKNNPEERARAAKIVQDMLRRGYALMVQVGMKDDKPLYQRAMEFDPEQCEYIIATTGDEVINIGTPAEPMEGTVIPAAKKKRGRPATVRLPADKTNAVAVARTAGG
jgi:hypothetical protein